MNQAETLTREEPVTVELLAEMYRNVTMGSENLACVVPHIRDKALMRSVTYQLEKYADYTNRTAALLHRYTVKPQDPTLMKKVMSRGGIAINTLFDDSDAHIAELIARGTQTGLEQLENKLTDFAGKGMDKDAVSLCREILDFEKKIVQEAGADRKRMQ